MTSDQPKPERCSNLLFADDSLTYASSMAPHFAAKRVEEHIRKLYAFYERWGIRINAAKSELVCFRRPSGQNRRRSRSAYNCRSVEVKLPNGTTISAQCNAKYLGIHFEERLRFNNHANAVLRKANFAFHRLYPLIKKRNGLSQPTKLLIYKQLLRPVIGYSFPVWFTISKTYMEKLKIFERKVLRICTDLQFDHQRQKHFRNEQVYAEAKVVPLDIYLLQLAKKLLQNIANHPNQIMREVATQERYPEPRYLSAMEIINERILPDTDEALRFYTDPGSAHHRG